MNERAQVRKVAKGSGHQVIEVRDEDGGRFWRQASDSVQGLRRPRIRDELLKLEIHLSFSSAQRRGVNPRAEGPSGSTPGSTPGWAARRSKVTALL